MESAVSPLSRTVNAKGRGEHMEEAAIQPTHVHAPPEGFIRKYVFSLDHKMIGKQYYGLALVAVFMGMVLSWFMRFHLVWPEAKIPGLGAIASTGAPGG